MASFNPEKVSYTQADIQKSATQAALAPGWYTFVTDSCKIEANDKGDIVAAMRESPVDPEDGETRLRPTAYLRVTMPLNNGEVNGHAAPDWAASITHQFLHAILPDDIPQVPRKDQGTGKWMYQGDEIDAEDVQSAKEEVYSKVFEFCTAWCADPNKVKDYTFVGKIVHDEKGYVNIKAIAPAIPSGESFNTKDQFAYRPAVKVEEKPKAAKANGKKTK
jgi:hypothetical protein